MTITREYLEEQLANLTRQAQEASATLHNANGAIATVRHLLSMLDDAAMMAPSNKDIPVSEETS